MSRQRVYSIVFCWYSSICLHRMALNNLYDYCTAVHLCIIAKWYLFNACTWALCLQRYIDFPLWAAKLRDPANPKYMVDVQLGERLKMHHMKDSICTWATCISDVPPGASTNLPTLTTVKGASHPCKAASRFSSPSTASLFPINRLRNPAPSAPAIEKEGISQHLFNKQVMSSTRITSSSDQALEDHHELSPGIVNVRMKS